MRLTTCNSGLLSTVILLLSISVEAEQIEEIIVTAKPIRDSQESAIRSKRLAVNVMDVVAADTIGRMPDQNLADLSLIHI